MKKIQTLLIYCFFFTFDVNSEMEITLYKLITAIDSTSIILNQYRQQSLKISTLYFLQFFCAPLQKDNELDIIGHWYGATLVKSPTKYIK